MKKRLLSLGLLLAGIFTCASCNNNSGITDETPLVLSSQELDGVFNPFYSSSAPDSNIVGMTQISMLGNDKKGNPTYGNDEPVVVLDYEYSYDGTSDTTTYNFVLKNNVKYSNGSPLTIKDVLFNLYVYLDPMYTGSSTIYSTDIVGLQEYRTQQGDEKAQEQFMEQFQIEAESRIDYLLTAAEWIFDEYGDDPVSYEDFLADLEDYSKEDGFENIVNDFNKVCELFEEELDIDYKNFSGGAYKDYEPKDKNNVTHYNVLSTDVEYFLLNEGYLYFNRETAKLESSLTNNVAELKNWTKEQAIEIIYKDKIPNALEEVALYWTHTSSEFYDYLVNSAVEEYHNTHDRTYSNISGIKFANKDEAVSVHGTSYAVPQYHEDGSISNGTNEVLSITINGVDPKAIWNFAFAVAPMYYYSTEEIYSKFDFEQNFGVEYCSQDFMEKVIKDPAKIGVPVGAGAYQAADEAHNTLNIESGDFKKNNTVYFVRNENYILGAPEIKYLHYQVVAASGLLNALYNGEVDFVQPNSNPDTITELNGKKSEGIQNTSIQTAGYGYIGVNAGVIPHIKVRQAIMHSIDTSMTVSYYGNTASAIHRSMSLTSWAYPDGATPYYPFIGGIIPEDLDVVNPDYADFIKEKGYSSGQTLSLDHQKEFIVRLVEDSEYVIGGDGVYVNGSNKLKITFTIAGSETDHPAFNAMYKAAELLNQVNFDITVSTDAQALSKLASGSLAVWAAAWSSTIDPDMYQVYHMDSTATSTLNWGYKQIKQNTGGKYNTELDLITELSEYIEMGRETEDRDARARIYSTALDIVMQLAVELPTYQRDDLYAYNINKIDESSLTKAEDLSPYTGLMSDLHLVRLNTNK